MVPYNYSEKFIGILIAILTASYVFWFSLAEYSLSAELAVRDRVRGSVFVSACVP